MSNKMISFHPEAQPSSAFEFHPPVVNKCRRFSTGSCKRSHTYGGALPLSALCSMLLFLLFCLLFLTLTGTRLHQEVLACTSSKSLRIHVIDNWWGVLYPPPTLSGGVVPEENTKNQSAESASDTLTFDNDINWLSQKKHIFFDMGRKEKAATQPAASSNNTITLRVTCRFLSFLPGGSER